MALSEQQRIAVATGRLARLLLARDWFISTAESCTGGWIAQSLTALPGSSVWFDTGFVTYSNQAKQRLLDVPAELLAVSGAGAVSEATVLAMTEGAVNHSRAMVAVAVSGIAGPDGGSPAKPVGTVWIAWQVPHRADAECFRFNGNRTAVRRTTVVTALEGMVQRLQRL